nr:xylulose kinase-1 [Tanacetum cinerariifolium]
MAGSDHNSDNASTHNEALNNHPQPNIQPQIITTVSNNNAKYPYLKKDEYEVWAMKIEYWITNNDMNIWKVIQNGNSLKRTGRGSDGGIIILPPTTLEEHLAVQRESKARTTLLQSIPHDHIADFHYMDDARDIWNVVKARFGGNAKSKKMRKSMLKQEFLEFRISETEGFHKGTNKKISYGDSPTQSSTTTYSVPSNFKTGSYRTGNMAMLFVRVHKFKQKAGRKIDFDKKESARFNKQKRYSSFKVKEIRKKEGDSKALIIVNTLVDWSNRDSRSDEVIAAKEFGMIAGCDSADAIRVGANKLYNLINGANLKEANTPGDAGEFALIGVTSEKELGWDDSAFSVFTTTSEDVEGRPTFYSDKSSEDNINDLALSDSGLKSLEHKPTDSSCASTSSVSTSINEAKNESNVGKTIKEPISLQDLPSFTCNSSDKNEHSSKTSCNKNGSFNKKMTNTTVSIGVVPAVRPQPVPTGKPKVKPVPT